MLTRVGALLVLFAALLQAAPIPAGSIQIRVSESVLFVGAEQERERQRVVRPKVARPVALAGVPRCEPRPPFPGFAGVHRQRPPPVLS